MILVVDDEEGIRDLSLDILELGGHDVLIAESGMSALNLLGARNPPIDLLLTDVTMPGMNGRELARQVRILRGETRVLFMSGLASMAGAVGDGFGQLDWMIDKPFTPDELLKLVAEIVSTPMGPRASR